MSLYRSQRRALILGTLGGLANGAFADDQKRLTIDSHVHVWKHDAQFPWAPDAANLPTADATAEKLLSLMEANSVSATVIIQVIYYKWDNRYLASILKSYPGRFHGVARVNPEDPASPDTLSKLTEEGRFHGVRISPAPTAAGDWIRGALMPPLWHRCEQLKVPMTVLAPVSRMPDIERLIERFPDLTVVIDHMADSPLQQPAELEKLLVLRRYPRVFVKISHSWSLSSQAYPYRDSQQQIKRLYASFGPKRLLAGTDWPLVEKYCTYGQAIDLARRQISFLNDNDRSWICGRTAQQIWPFPNV